jgi:hypothetical protein
LKAAGEHTSSDAAPVYTARGRNALGFAPGVALRAASLSETVAVLEAGGYHTQHCRPELLTIRSPGRISRRRASFALDADSNGSELLTPVPLAQLLAANDALSPDSVLSPSGLDGSVVDVRGYDSQLDILAPRNYIDQVMTGQAGDDEPTETELEAELTPAAAQMVEILSKAAADIDRVDIMSARGRAADRHSTAQLSSRRRSVEAIVHHHDSHHFQDHHGQGYALMTARRQSLVTSRDANSRAPASRVEIEIKGASDTELNSFRKSARVLRRSNSVPAIPTACDRVSEDSPTPAVNRRTRKPPSMAQVAGRRSSNVSNVSGDLGDGKRCSLTHNAKLRRAVHKLVLINRFNNNAHQLLGDDMRTSRSNTSDGTTATRYSSANINPNLARAASLFMSKRSRWGAPQSRRKSIARTMDTYIKEQSNMYQYGEQRQAESDKDEQLPWYIIRPDGKFRMIWDTFLFCLVLYASFMVPIKIGFDVDDSTYQSLWIPTHAPFFSYFIGTVSSSFYFSASADVIEAALDYLSDIFFIIDIVTNFMTTYKEDGVLVRNRRKVSTS